MRIAVTGSIATDYLMTFPGRFTEALVGDQLERLSLSFLVDELEIRRGGVAANICFGLGQLGVRPLLVGAVGHDFDDDYGAWLRRHGVDTSTVRVSTERHTARFLCTTDEAESQIASFYAGAMSDARYIELSPILERYGAIDLVVVSPNDPEAMVRHTEDALGLGLPVMADPSQQLARMEGPEIRRLLDGAAWLVGNDYEMTLCQGKTGWSSEEILSRVGTRVTTHGAKGVTIERVGEETIEVESVPPTPGVPTEPTGAGDAFRAGFLAGLARNLDLASCAQLACLVATISLESVGPQEYRISAEEVDRRLTKTYDAEAADRILAALGWRHI
jgi:adenosine kinase